MRKCSHVWTEIFDSFEWLNLRQCTFNGVYGSRSTKRIWWVCDLWNHIWIYLTYWGHFLLALTPYFFDLLCLYFFFSIFWGSILVVWFFCYHTRQIYTTYCAKLGLYCLLKCEFWWTRTAEVVNMVGYRLGLRNDRFTLVFFHHSFYWGSDCDESLSMINLLNLQSIFNNWVKVVLINDYLELLSLGADIFIIYIELVIHVLLHSIDIIAHWIEIAHYVNVTWREEHLCDE